MSTAVVELYWMPGCSSCLRMKEFVESSGVAYEAINVDAEPERAGKLRERGVHVPQACFGDRCVSGQDLGAVAELIGVSYDPPTMLEPAELVKRHSLILDAFDRFVVQLPEGALHESLRDRKRPLLEVCGQIVAVVRAFLTAYYDDNHNVRLYATPADVTTADHLLARSSETRQMMRDWWDQDGVDDALERVVATYWGHPTLHEILEREVWHTAQHVRQIQYALELQGITPNGPLTDAELGGLPLPERVHD